MYILYLLAQTCNGFGSSMLTMCWVVDLLCMCSGSDDEVDDTPIETTADTELYKLTLPTEVSAAPQVNAPAVHEETPYGIRNSKTIAMLWMHASGSQQAVQAAHSAMQLLKLELGMLAHCCGL